MLRVIINDLKYLQFFKNILSIFDPLQNLIWIAKNVYFKNNHDDLVFCNTKKYQNFPTQSSFLEKWPSLDGENVRYIGQEKTGKGKNKIENRHGSS